MVSGIITAVLLSVFLVGTLWAYSPRRKHEFDAAAALPLIDDDDDDDQSDRAQETDR